jgi:hypothetical protein
MAFTGVPVVQKVTDRCFRITGVSLAGDASGTIGFSDKTVLAEASIVAPDWQPYELDGVVSLQDMVRVDVNIVTDVTTPVPVSVVKTGTTHLDFAITLHNDTAATASGNLEIYVTKAA